MTYQTKEITDEILADTESAWKLIAGSDEFDSEYLVLFDWLKTHRDYSVDSGHSAGYALVQDNLKVASAFFEVVSSANLGGLTKLLKVYITPRFWNIHDHRNEIIKIYLACIMAVIELSKSNHARTVKIYGRTDAMMSLLESIHVELQGQLNGKPMPGLKFGLDGRWLYFSTN